MCFGSLLLYFSYKGRSQRIFLSVDLRASPHPVNSATTFAGLKLSHDLTALLYLMIFHLTAAGALHSVSSPASISNTTAPIRSSG
jgi:hypothetical protein